MDIIEEKKELCTVASKLVSVRIVRHKESQESSGDGEIIDFHCADSSSSCESKCTYKMMLEDF